jgi:integrase
MGIKIPEMSLAAIKQEIAKRADREDYAFGIGRGLQLQHQRGAFSFVFRYMLKDTGQQRSKGMGAFDPKSEHAVHALAHVRAETEKMRLEVRDGGDPVWSHRVEAQDREANRAKQAQAEVTFEELATKVINEAKEGWHGKTDKQWTASLAKYAYPTIGKLTPRQITRQHVLDIVKPIWFTKHALAFKLRQRIGAVLNIAVAQELVGTNVARLAMPELHKAHMVRKKRPVRHNKPLPWAELPEFLTKVEQHTNKKGQRNKAALPLLFAIMTAQRAVNVGRAKWGQIEMDSATWCIPPGDRLKKNTDEDFVCPLNAKAMEILRSIRPANPKPTDRIFDIGESAHTALTDEVKRHAAHVTGHGTIRGSFSTWCKDTEKNFWTKEAQLDHSIDATAEAYEHTTVLPLRRKLMNEWHAHCYPKSGSNVVNMIERLREAV